MTAAHDAAAGAIDRAQQERVKRGRDAEKRLDALHKLCRAQGVAKLRKVGTPFEIVGAEGGGILKVRLTGKAGVDYVGVMLDGSGRGIALECKRIAEGRFPLSRIDDEQRDDLDAYDGAGALAILVVYHGEADALFALPWDEVRAIEATGWRSLSLEDLRPWRIEPGQPYLRRWSRATSR